MDYNVRKAMELAIDRESIVKDVIGDGTVATSIFTTNEFGYDPNIPKHVYDPAAAKAALAASSYDGREIVLTLEHVHIKIRGNPAEHL